jgi:hypothetical protein
MATPGRVIIKLSPNECHQLYLQSISFAKHELNPSRLRLRVGTDALPFNKFAIDEVGIEELMDKAEQLHRKIENSAKIALNSP